MDLVAQHESNEYDECLWEMRIKLSFHGDLILREIRCVHVSHALLSLSVQGGLCI